MNDHDPLTPISDDFIDRIVDGELPRELREAVAILDQHPEGWKRCGLAFLESQCWRESLRTLPQPTTYSLTSQSPLLRRSAPSLIGARHWLRSPIAAGIIAASFAMGWVGHATQRRPGPERAPIVQADATRNLPAGRSPSGMNRLTMLLPRSLRVWPQGSLAKSHLFPQ